jgi:hypothetical protein
MREEDEQPLHIVVARRNARREEALEVGPKIPNSAREAPLREDNAARRLRFP